MIVKVDGLKKKYKKDWVLKGIDIEVKEPQIIALVGPNGSGKTTLMNCMTNLLTYDQGEVELLGQKNTDTKIFKDVSYLQDNRILYGTLTAYDHLKFICDVQGLPKSKIEEVAKRVGMESYLKKRVQNFSLGMKQHLLLAMVIINDPKVLLMDEPLTGLDPTSAIDMRNILLELREEGTTVIVSSHNLDEIDRLTNKIYFLKDGALLKESLEQFATKEYYLTVDDLTKAEDVLEETAITFSVYNQEQITFEETDVELQTVINHLNKQGVAIVDIENERVGAEKRYRELFEGDASV
ncbi:ABC transporter ATP-binding protein [Alkalibacillus haloalkaliphilus]|uniref:ABC transporter ATP-binding protein n=1 Tax=Alkalibacillus haloalkaliphilus TaxID=94136 RepID=UPI0029360A1B|nr:ABC transporter ATP-binding protein [Alkalibacillus haloalkaliphilus]MDV2583503.1 ABC transporter ATP-binding protein [Alkalibacillus haloalkaliphilus]